MRTSRYFSFAAVALLAGCGGGSSISPALSLPPPAAPAATIVALSTSATSVPLSGAVTGSVLLPGASNPPSGSTIALSASESAPGGAPVLASFERSAESASADIALIFVQSTTNAAVNFSGLPGFVFSLANANINAANGPFFIALLDPTKSPAAWQPAVEGPGVVGGGNITFAQTQTPATFAANESYVFALYQVSGGAAWANAITVSPSSLTFLGNAPGDAQSLTVSEAGYAGAFAATSTCTPSIAVISGSGPSFTVTPLGVGACTATFTDSAGHSAVVPISVAITLGGGQ